jgi:hypothetical protein
VRIGLRRLAARRWRMGRSSPSRRQARSTRWTAAERQDHRPRPDGRTRQRFSQGPGRGSRFFHRRNDRAADADRRLRRSSRQRRAAPRRGSSAGQRQGSAAARPRAIWAADIGVTADGRFVYLSERTTSQLIRFRRDPESGVLEYLGAVPTETQPRAFAIDDNGTYLAAASEKSGHISVQARPIVTTASCWLRPSTPCPACGTAEVDLAGGPGSSTPTRPRISAAAARRVAPAPSCPGSQDEACRRAKGRGAAAGP